MLPSCSGNNSLLADNSNSLCCLDLSSTVHFEPISEVEACVSLQLAKAKALSALHDSVLIYIVTHRHMVKMDVQISSVVESGPLEHK